MKDVAYSLEADRAESSGAGRFARSPAWSASWAASAATGNPNNAFTPHWEKYTANNRQTMELNSKGCVCHKDVNTQNLNALRYIYES